MQETPPKQVWKKTSAKQEANEDNERQGLERDKQITESKLVSYILDIKN